METFKKHDGLKIPNAKRYKDYRVMLSEMESKIDAGHRFDSGPLALSCFHGSHSVRQTRLLRKTSDAFDLGST